MKAKTAAKEKSCNKCHRLLPNGAAFCPTCGRRAQQLFADVKPVHLLLITVLSLCLFAASWSMQKKLTGEKPSLTYRQYIKLHPELNSTDNTLEELKASAIKTNSKEAWQTVVTYIMKNYAASKGTSSTELLSSEMAAEMLDALRAMLAIDPNDSRTILLIAELSFDKQAFSKAAEFYARYLQIVPGNPDVIARYASSLTFLGQYTLAIDELKKALEKDPNNFKTLAYLSIAYAETGEKKLALKNGRRALTVAPSEEARAKLGQYIAKISGGKAPSASNGARAGQREHGVENFIELLKKNRIAGPKLNKWKISANSLLLYFDDFPMAAMPPFAKEKFFKIIKENAKGADLAEINEVQFVDRKSGKLMAELQIKTDKK